MKANLMTSKKFLFLATSVSVGMLLADGASAFAAGGTGFVSYNGGTYTQDFNTLAYQSATVVNSANPVTLVNSEVSGSPTITYTLPNTTALPVASPSTYSFSDTTLGGGTALSTASGTDLGMDGWWGTCIPAASSNPTVSNRYGAQDGSTTTGGQISFGGLTSSNRALGLLSTSTTGATSMGVAIENTGTTTLTSFTLSYTGELWRQTTTQKFLHFGFLVTPTNVSSDTSGGGLLPTSGTTGDSALDVTFATGASANGSNSGPVSSTSLSDTISGISWAPNTTLWLTWQTWAGTSANAGGSAQGVAIDNLVFSASGASGGAAAPEPVSLSLLGLGVVGLIARRRKA